jgi:predicted acylesterase/phospholipase RssA
MRVLCILVAVAVLLSGCAGVIQRNPVPELLVDKAVVGGFPDVRFWGDEQPENAMAMMREAFERQKAAGLLCDGPGQPRPQTFLALSGGGSEGAFGAGLLVGWTAAGTRPEFSIVTGVSTGALIAPFAFVGPEYDDHLEAFYTTMHTEDIFRLRALFSLLGRDSFSDTSPLQELLEEHVDERFLKRVAEEYAKGRTLWIGTTNLDAQRPVIWDMGAIAASNHPRAAELFRAIMLASAAIGGAFPPVYMPVEVDGQVYDEMHVDGGTANQVFLYPAALDVKSFSEQTGLHRERSVYVIRNAKISPQWEAVEPRLGRIAVRSVATLIKTQGIGDLFRIYVGARRDGMDYNLAYVPTEFDAERKSSFDPVYMRKLFDFAHTLAKNGFPWVKEPPGFAPTEVE